MDSEGVKLRFNGYDGAIQKPTLVSHGVPIETSIEFESLRLKRKKMRTEIFKRLDRLTSSGERRETLRPQQERRCLRMDEATNWRLKQGI